jgi:hypothetical protein
MLLETKDNVFCGQDNIREVLARLPASSHNLDKREMVIDAFMLNVIPGYPNAINLHIHGDFTSGMICCVKMFFKNGTLTSINRRDIR